MNLLRPLTLAFALGLAALVAPAEAQEAGGEEKSEGSPVPGYIATGTLACAAIFVLCKSARR